MAEEMDNPLDDELLKELGLEPQGSPAAKKTKPAVPNPKVPPAKPAPGGSQRVPTPGAVAKQPTPPVRSPIPPQKSSPPQVNNSQNVAPPATPGQSPEKFNEGLKNLSEDMPVQVVAVLGKRTMSLKDVISLKQGEIIELKKMPQETIDLVANGKLIARGELVLVEGKVGVQVKKLMG